MKILRNSIQGFSRALALMSAAMILVMMFVMTLEVGSRATGHGSLPWSYGLIQLLLVAAVFAASGYGEQAGEHIRVDLFTARMPARVAAVFRTVGNLVGVIVVAVMCYTTAERAIESVEVGEYQDGIIAFPVWPSRVMLTIGLIALLLELILKLIETTTAMWKSHDELLPDADPAKEATL